MSMAAMVRDMRNRFLVAAVFSVPILLWSPIGRNVLGFTVAAPRRSRCPAHQARGATSTGWPSGVDLGALEH